MKTRIYFLDNLRTFLIFLVVVLHAGIVYEPILEYTWIVSDPVKNSSIGFIRMYIDIFVMFTLFYISGYFIPASIKNKSDKEFLISKFKRIMLPWVVAVFTLIPAYKAIFLYSRDLPQEEWFTYFHLFSRVGGHMGYFADNPVQNWLWFLPVLFLFQVVYWILSKTNVFSIKISLKTGVILTFVIGLLYSMLIAGLDLRGWFHSPLLHFQKERLFIYFMVFLLGSLSYKLKVFESTQQNKKLYIWANVTLTLGLGIFTIVALNLFFNMIEPGRDYFFVSATVDRMFYYSSLLLSMFSFLYVFIHVFRFRFNRTNWMMNELNKNSYAVYIIHVIVIGLVAVALLNAPLPAFAKFTIVTIVAYVVSNLLVSAYRELFQKALSKRAISIAIVPAAILLSIIIYASNEESPNAEVQPSSVMAAPEISIHLAALQGNVDAIQQHINAGTDLNQKEPTAGSTPLITAALFGKVEVATMLINAGADVNYQNNEGSTALHTAAFFCQQDIVRILLENGADKNLKNNAGSTPLESVQAPFEFVKGYYEYFQKTLGPLGLELDYEEIKTTRPVIVGMLSNPISE